MLEGILEGIVELVGVLILQFPGAFVRWMFTGFKKGKFKEFLDDDPYKNSFVVIIAFIIIGISIYLIFTKG